MSAPHAATQTSVLVEAAKYVSDHWVVFLVVAIVVFVMYAFRFEILRDQAIAKTKHLWKDLHFYGDPKDFNQIRLVIDDKLHEQIERLNHEYEAGHIDVLAYGRLVKALLNAPANSEEQKLLGELTAI